jgi:hypothetical protein
MESTQFGGQDYIAYLWRQIMKTLLLLSFLLTFIWPAQDGALSNDGSAVVVRDFKWSKSRQTVAQPETVSNAPAPAMIQANKNFERNKRVNDPVGAPDPNAESLDGRRAAMEKNVQDARAPKPTPLDGFAYRVKVQNASAKVIEVLFWEYQFTELSNPTNVVRRQFLCGVNIKPSKEKELQVFSLSGPSNVISAESLANKSEKLFREKVVINRVEYSDGSIWQRKDWNFAEVKPSIARALATPWGLEMCRGL